MTVRAPGMGHYLPNPAMLMRHGEDWQPVFELMGMPWIDAGCAVDDGYSPSPAQRVERLGQVPADLAPAVVSESTDGDIAS